MVFSAMCDGSAGPVAFHLDNAILLDGVCAVPFVRWDAEIDFTGGSSPGRQHVRFGGFTLDVERWDAQFFGISLAQAVQTDPQQRMLLSLSYSVLVAGRETVSMVKGMSRSVAIGICSSEYAGCLAEVRAQVTPFTSLAAAMSVACGRISYTFGMQGPCVSVETACSSSLMCTHISMKFTRSLESDSAMAGGVCTTLQPYGYTLFLVSGMLAQDSRCKTLDQAADGYVRAEGCGLIELQPYADSMESILVAIRGSASNQDGRSSSLTAPNGPSQQAVLRSALRDGAVMCEEYRQLEMHGTGTSLGDPIELGAATAVLLNEKETRGPLSLWAAKTAYGHAEGSAGILGVLHALTSISHAHTSFITNLRSINRFVADTMSVSNSTLAPRQNISLLSTLSSEFVAATGVSAFAFQGTNAHVVLGSEDDCFAHTTNGKVVWEERSIWVAPRLHPFLTVAHVALKTLNVFMHMLSCAMNTSYLWERSLCGRSVIPETGLMELSNVAARSCLAESSTTFNLSLTNLSFHLPLVMPDTNVTSGVLNPLANCLMNVRTGEYEIQDLCHHFNSTSSVYLDGTALHSHSGIPMVMLSMYAPMRTTQSFMDYTLLGLCSASVSSYTVACSMFGGSVQLDLKKIDGSGYKAHPAAMENCLQLNSRADASMANDITYSVESFSVVGCACRVNGITSLRVTTALGPNSSSIGTFSLQDGQQSTGLAIGTGVHTQALSKILPLVTKTTVWGNDFKCGRVSHVLGNQCADASISLHQRASIQSQVWEIITTLLGTPLEPETPLLDAGLDSLGAVELRSCLARTIGVQPLELVPYLAIDYPTVNAITAYLESEVASRRSTNNIAELPRHRDNALDTVPNHVLHCQVMDIVASLLGMPVEPDEPLLDAGLDSLGVAELRIVLARHIGIAPIEIIPTLVFDYPNVSSLTGYLVSVMPLSNRPHSNQRGHRPTMQLGTDMLSLVQDVVTSMLGRQLPADTHFLDAGMDFQGAILLGEMLAVAVGIDLPNTVVFENTSVEALAAHLRIVVGHSHDVQLDGGMNKNNQALSPGADKDWLYAIIMKTLSTVAGVNVEPDDLLLNIGMESLKIAELCAALGGVVGLRPIQITSSVIEKCMDVHSLVECLSLEILRCENNEFDESRSFASPSQDRDIVSRVQSVVDELLGYHVPNDAHLMEAGVDFQGAISLGDMLAGVVGVEVPSTLVFDNPTVSTLADRLQQIVNNTMGLMESTGYQEDTTSHGSGEYDSCDSELGSMSQSDVEI